MFKTRIAKRGILISICIAILICLFQSSVHAVNATAYTFTISPDLEWIRTQDAYLVEEVMFQDYNLSSPSDIYLRGKKMYIADTGNSRIVVRDIASDKITTFGEDVLSAPTGVFATQAGNIYVADTKMVYMFDADGKLLKEYGRPKSITFGASSVYQPVKVAADEAGTLYVTSDGTFEGIIQLAENGEFLGYFGYNNMPLSPVEIIQELFFTDEQKARLFNKVPYAFSNVVVDDTGLIYSLTAGTLRRTLKKHNISGLDMFENMNFSVFEKTFSDLAVGKYGQIYAVSESGLIYEYDSDGNLLFSLGGSALTAERNGLMTVASGIAVDDSDSLYVLDKERGKVHVFAPTQFSVMLHEAIDLYNKGKYEQSRDIWQEILRESGSSKMVHRGLGNCYLQLREYDMSEEHYRLAKEVPGYSESFWEIRNKWLVANVGYILLAVVVIVVAWFVLKFIDKRKHIFDPIRRFRDRLKRFKPIRDTLFMGRFIKNPADGFYDIRHDLNGSPLIATILYIATFIIYVWSMIGLGFVITPVTIEKVNLLFFVGSYFIPVALFIVCNYMVSSINDGESRFKDVYIAVGYSLTPIVIFLPIINIFSYFVTINEMFMITFPTIVVVIWSVILLIVGLKQINDYEFGDVIKNILLTVFFMCIIVLVFTMIQMFWDKIIDLIYSVVKEVAYRVAD